MSRVSLSVLQCYSGGTAPLLTSEQIYTFIKHNIKLQGKLALLNKAAQTPSVVLSYIISISRRTDWTRSEVKEM